MIRSNESSSEIPVLDLEDADTTARVEQNEIWPKAVEVRLDIDLPLSREVPFEEVENDLSPGVTGCRNEGSAEAGGYTRRPGFKSLLGNNE